MLTRVGKHLETRSEYDNPVDRFAVAVHIQDNIVGQLPKGKLNLTMQSFRAALYSV